jgi:hypothetical protein
MILSDKNEFIVTIVTIITIVRVAIKFGDLHAELKGAQNVMSGTNLNCWHALVGAFLHAILHSEQV